MITRNYPKDYVIAQTYFKNMNELSNGLEYVTTYLDDLLIISNKSFEDHIKKLDNALSKLNQKGFKMNTEKSFFARNELEYLGFRITRQGITMPLPDKVEAIKNIAVSTTKRELKNIIGLIIIIEICGNIYPKY